MPKRHMKTICKKTKEIMTPKIWLTWTRRNTRQLRFKCGSRTWLPVVGGGRVSTSSGSVDYGSSARVFAERPLTPFCIAAVNWNDISWRLGSDRSVFFSMYNVMVGRINDILCWINTQQESHRSVNGHCFCLSWYQSVSNFYIDRRSTTLFETFVPFSLIGMLVN